MQTDNKLLNQKEYIPESMYNNWQRIVRIMANMMEVTTVLITRIEKPHIKIVTTNDSNNNPLASNQEFELTGYYCEKVIKNKEMLEISNSLKDKNWNEHPELDYDLISYLGLPIEKPNGDIFGTICVMDKKERNYKKDQKELLLEFKKVVENQLENIELKSKLNNKLNDVQEMKEKYETLFNNINDLLFLHGISKENDQIKLSKFIEVNETACKQLGYEENELLNMSPGDLDSSQFDNSQEKEKSLLKLYQKGEITFEAEHVRKNGEKLPVEVNSKVIEYNNQKFVLSTARDISKRKKVENKLKEQRNLTRSVLNSLSANITVLDKEGLIKFTNKAWNDFARNNGLSSQKWNKGINYLTICKDAKGKSSEEAPLAYSGIKKVIKGQKKLFTLEYPCHSPEEKRWFQMRVTPFQGEGPYAAVVSHVNITERKLIERERKQQKQKLEKILETTMDGFFTLNSEGKFLKGNEAYLDMVSYSRKELVNMKLVDIDCKENSKETNLHLQQIKKDGSDRFETKYKTRQGNIINVEVSITYMDEFEESLYFAFVRDITERKQEEEKIKYLSFHDQQTDLYNRRYFENELDRLEQSRKFPISIIVGDMDGLKEINDNYGHQMGDKYIKKAGEVFESITRKEDIVARIGGDEFALILPKNDEEIAERFCERLKTKCQKCNQTSNLPLPLSISVGYFTANSKDNNLKEVFKKADRNMYENKGRIHR